MKLNDFLLISLIILNLKYILKNILAEKHYGWKKYLRKSD